MKIPKLNITNKDLALVSLGISASLVCSIFNQPIFVFALIGMFFGLLSKGIRWKYWGVNILINAFIGFRTLLETDLLRAFAVEMIRLMNNMVNQPIPKYSVDIVNNTLLTNSSNIAVNLFVDAADIIIVKDSMMAKILLAVLVIIGVVIAILYIIYSFIALIAAIIVFTPIFGYVALMIFWFHNEEFLLIPAMLESGIITEHMVDILMPYFVQGMVLECLLAYAILPLIFYRVLKRLGFYNRIQNIAA